jgi:hypothetical protein
VKPVAVEVTAAKPRRAAKTEAGMEFPLLDEFVSFVTERWAIHQRRLSGKPAPWTTDPILLKYKFTNVRREDDRVTRWLHEHWLRPHQDDLPSAVFAMCLARIVNLPSTMEALGYPSTWNAKRFTRIMESRKADGLRSFNGAYMINAVGATRGQSKASYLAESVLPGCWAARKRVAAALETGSLRAAFDELIKCNGMGTFMSAQILADIKNTPVGLKAADWSTFAASGPGSRRGLMRLQGIAVSQGKSGYPGTEADWHATLLELRKQVLPLLPKELKKLDAQNLQSCLCEMDKRCRVPEGRRPKQLFKPSEEEYC